ncbi:MAG TPA: response regulator transcription factor [Candidatus Acidoferrum sp.]
MAKILVADGNVRLRLLLTALVESRDGWQVCGEAADGAEVVQKALELKPDLIVLDFAMGGLNGLQAAAKILATHPAMPIILHTFYGFDAMIAEAKKVGIRDVVPKGESANRLCEAIEKSLAAEARSSRLLIMDAPVSEQAGTETSRQCIS